MEGNKMISIIVPVYNTKEYLSQCIESLTNQTYKDLEIICVNDGSTDGSKEILKKYEKLDKRIKLIHQNNHGESHARNIGLTYAKGDYIAFCDCDDWIDSNMYETLIQEMQNDDLDLVAAGWYKDTLTEGKWISTKVENEKSVLNEAFNQSQLLHYLYERDSYRGFSYMWNKLYRRDVLLDENDNIIEFDESLKLGGDVLYLARVALNVKKTKYVDEPFYHYRIRESSGSHTTNYDSYRDWINSYEQAIELYEKNSVEKEIIDYLRRFLAYHAWEAAGIAIEEKNSDEYKYFEGIMIDYQDVYERKNNEHPERIIGYRKRIGRYEVGKQRT